MTETKLRFSYEEAFRRNIGWVTEGEQRALRGKTVAIAGLGGVGGVHLLTLARLGIGAFRIADPDRFEAVNINRQIGATSSTMDRPKAEVLAEMARDINPELRLTLFPDGVSEANIDDFLDGVDLYVDGLDFFVLDIRAKVFARCAERGIPAVTAAPLGFGAAYLIFLPGGMSFEAYFRLAGLPSERQYVNFFLGLAPKGLQGGYLVDPTRLDLTAKRGPSTAAGCNLCAAVIAAEAVKILLERGPVRAVPAYHQFDAFRGEWASGRLRWGNRGPLQRLKLAAAYRKFAAPVAAPVPKAAAPAAQDGPEIARILDLARWAPSGDNAQPWRFEIRGPDRVRIHIRDQAGEDVYDYAGGQPTLLSAGMLLETLRIAASDFGRMAWWTYRGATGHDHVVDVELAPAPAVRPDPLLAQITARSVDRRPYRTASLTAAQKNALVEALGDELEIRWHESLPERWRVARVSALATDIRLRIPEAFAVHKRILDWTRHHSPDGVPAQAVGLDPVTLAIMRWGMVDWRRMARLNRLPGATLAARLQMDLIPGLACAAHFTVALKDPPQGGGDAAPSLLKAGEALQRFWLTATKLGLVMQPSLAPLCFADYGRRGAAFTADAAKGMRARVLADRVEDLHGGDRGQIPLFLGRLGMPRSRPPIARSVRLPLAELLVPREDRSAAAKETAPPPPISRAAG